MQAQIEQTEIQQWKIRVEGLGKRYTGGSAGEVVAFNDVNMTVGDGEFVSLVGPSGCGKTTLLHVIAGLVDPSTGAVTVSGLGSSERLGRIAYMFQRDLLLPWKRVLDNVSLGLELQGVPRRDARRQALEHFERFGLAGFADAYPETLSGGMRQRAALLRTLLAAQRHRVLLLDEPLGALDSLTRMDMQEWLQHAWTTFRPTVLMVTHDIDEAVFLSDRVYVMTPRPGHIIGELPIPLARPRNRDIVTSPAFTALKEKVLDMLRRGSRWKTSTPQEHPTRGDAPLECSPRESPSQGGPPRQNPRPRPAPEGRDSLHASR